MAIFKVNKTSDYTVISNYHLKERNMSLKAKGLLTQMLSLPDTWDFSVEGLIKLNKENETAIKSALKELKEFGYLVVTKKMPNETKSKRLEYIYDIYEMPFENQEGGFLPLENQPLENQGQLNTNNQILKNKKENIKEIEIEFNDLWSLYPRKLGKQVALKSYIKARQEGTTYQEVKDGIGAYTEYLKKNKTGEKYIKHGSTWFNQRGWLDDYGDKAPEMDEETKELLRLMNGGE